MKPLQIRAHSATEIERTTPHLLIPSAALNNLPNTLIEKTKQSQHCAFCHNVDR